MEDENTISTPDFVSTSYEEYLKWKEEQDGKTNDIKN